MERWRRVTFLAKLISMKYKGKGNIKEDIMEMFNLASKLMSLKPDWWFLGLTFKILKNNN